MITIIMESEEPWALRNPRRRQLPAPVAQKTEKSFMQKLIDSDDVTFALDVVSALGVAAEFTGVGALPGGIVSVVADVLNAARMVARGDLIMAGLYLIMAIPVAGDVLQGLKILKGGKSSAKVLKLLMGVMKQQKIQQSWSTIERTIDKVAPKIPGGEAAVGPAKAAAGVIMSGDHGKMAELAAESGYSDLAAHFTKMAKKKAPRTRKPRKPKAGTGTTPAITPLEPANSPFPDSALAEARNRRSLMPLYKTTLYGRDLK
jgi:hypothetical protein